MFRSIGRHLPTARTATVAVAAAAPQRRHFASSCAPLLQQRSASEVKMARVLSMEVNRLKAQYRMAPSPELKRKSLDELAAVPLKQVQQLDLKTVAHLLGALEDLRAPADHPIIREAAEWLMANTNSLTANVQLANALNSISALNKALATDVFAAVNSRIVATQSDIDAQTASKLLSAARGAGVSVGKRRETGSVAAASSNNSGGEWQDHCISVLRANIPTAHPTDVLAMAHALHGSPNDGVLFVEIVGIVAASLNRLQPSEIAQVVRLLSTSYITEAVRTARLTEALDALDGVASSLTAGDAAVLYDSLKGFVDPSSDALAQRIVATASKVPLGEASIGEALSIATRLKERTPSAVMGIITGQLDAQFGTILANPSSEVAALFAALAACPLLQQLGLPMRLGDRVMAELRKMMAAAGTNNNGSSSSGSGIPADVLAAVMTTPMALMYGAELHTMVMGSFERWHYADTLLFVTAASNVPTAEARKILRDMAQKLAQSVHLSTPAQLTVLACAYGKAGVRNDILCGAVADKAVKDRALMRAHDLACCLGFLSAVDYKNNKCFVELQLEVRTHANACGPTEVVNLIAGYAKMLLWNLKLFYPLVARAAFLVEFFSISQILGVLISIDRVDVRHPPLTVGLVRRLEQLAPTTDARSSIQLLAAMSRYGIHDKGLFEALGANAAAGALRPDSTLTAADLGDLLMSFVRARYTDHPIFHDVIMPVLAVAPTATPVAISNLATAYSAIGLKHEELFEILGDRTLVLKDECPAVVIAGILAAFARVGIRNDKLFIEMIYRAKLVPTFGTPQDIVNVVTAYSLGGVWHMRLFMKLAERAIYLRGEFRGALIAELLSGFARVEMKHDKLFAEFSPRIQACALTLKPCDCVSIVQSYAAVMIPDAAVFEVLGDRLSTCVPLLTEDEKRAVMAAYSKVGITHNELASALSGLPPTA